MWSLRCLLSSTVMSVGSLRFPGIAALVVSVVVAGCGLGTTTVAGSSITALASPAPSPSATMSSTAPPSTAPKPPAALTVQTAPCENGPGLQLSTQEDYVYVKGNICPDVGDEFIQYMSTLGQAYRVVRLNSSGGAGIEAVKIGQYLRDHAITTWVDAEVDQCASACNRVFAGGAERIYSNADDIRTGKNPQYRFGLGFHHPNHNGDFQAADPFYRSVIAPYLQRMLPPAAYDWVFQTDESNLTYDMTWLNGRQALQLGIATSSAPPS
jgi:hypothetical protein